MSAVGKLAEVDAAASPGPWQQQFELDYDSGKETEFPIVLAAPGTAMGGHRLQIIGGFRDEPEMALADAQLAALSKLLLPAYRALEDSEACCGDEHGARAPLKALEEAMEAK